MLLLRFTGVLLCACSITALAETPAEIKPVTDRIASSIYTGPSMSTLRELSDGFGGRVTGSPAYNHATEWAVAKFRSVGLQNARLEPFSIPSGWERGSASGAIVAPWARPLNLASVGWSPSTPPGGVQAEVVILSDISPEKLKDLQNLRGKIVFLDTAKIFAEGYVKAIPKLDAALPKFQKAGVVGAVMSDREKDNVLNAHDMIFGAQMLPFPAAQIGMEDSKLIQRLAEKGPVTIHFALENKTSGATKINNVLAELPGSDPSAGWILIGAHLDSWDFGTGAQDNGTGTVSVIEVARTLAALGKAPRRTIRFALWGGEEQGLLGSYAYAQAHKDDLKNCVAVLNTDNGAGHPKGWKVEGRTDLKDAMQPLSDILLKDLSGGELSMDTTFDTDHGPFMLAGVPALDLYVDMSGYFEIHHKSSDTIDKVDPLDFKAGEAIVAVTGYALSQADDPIAGHIEHAKVGEILKEAKLDELLQHLGMWKP